MKSKRQKSSSSTRSESETKSQKSSSSSQPESETSDKNGSLLPSPSSEETKLNPMATAEEAGDTVTTVAETDVNTKNESEGETKETKEVKSVDDESDKASSKNVGQDDVDGKDVDTKKSGRTGASKSEGEADDNDDDEEEDVFPDGAVSGSPTKSNTLPAITSSQTMDPVSPTSPTCKETSCINLIWATAFEIHTPLWKIYCKHSTAGVWYSNGLGDLTILFEIYIFTPSMLLVGFILQQRV